MNSNIILKVKLEFRQPYYGMMMLFKGVGRPYYGVRRPYYGMMMAFMGRGGCITGEGVY